MLNTWFKFSVTDSKILDITGEITSFKVIYEILELPKFEMSANFVSPKQDLGPFEFTLTINNGTTLKVYTCTITRAEGTLYYGYILPKVSLFFRKSRSLTNTLSSALRTLNMRNELDVVNISSTVPFLQLNETDAECFKRLADYCGCGKLWGINYNKVSIFDLQPLVPLVDFNTHIVDGFTKFDSSNTSEFDISNKASVDVDSNLFFKSEVVPIPSLNKFSRECISSYLEKKKLREWRNIILKRKFRAPLDNVELGTGVFINGFKSNKFLISKIEIIYTRYTDMFIYEASSFDGWNVYYD